MAYPNRFDFLSPSPTPLNAPLIAIDAIRIYYLVRGRNAWHSTWVKNYFNTCFHSSLDSAKKEAERMRERGSKFYILEIPGILLQTEYSCAVITQINSNVPFGDYSPRRAARHLKSAIAEHRCKMILRRGARLLLAIRSFDPSGEHWSSYQRTKNNIVVEYGDKDEQKWISKSREGWRRWTSYAQGSNYYLGWKEEKSDIDPQPSIHLAKAAKRAKPISASTTTVLQGQPIVRVIRPHQL